MHLAGDAGFDFVEQVVGVRNVPLPGHKDVYMREAASARATGAQPFVADALRCIAGQDGLDGSNFITRNTSNVAMVRGRAP